MNSHISRNHSDDNLDSATEESGRETISYDLEPTDLAIDSGSSAPQTAETSHSSACAVNQLCNFEQLQRTTALYLLTLKEKYKVTQTAIDFTVSQMKNAVDKMVDDLCSAVGEEVKKTSSLTDEDVIRILSVFQSTRNPFMGLETQYLQSKYFYNYFSLVVSH